MTWVDVVLVILILFLAYGGYLRGVVQETFDLLVLGVGTGVALRFFGPLADWMMPFTGLSVAQAHWVAFLGLFLPIAAGVFTLGIHLDQMQAEDTSVPRPLKAGLGATLGAVKGLFLAWLVLVALHHLPVVDEDLRRDLMSAPVVQAVQGLQTTYVSFAGAMTPNSVSRWLLPALDKRW